MLFSDQVFYTETSQECGELADVFNFKTIKMNTFAASYEGNIVGILYVVIFVNTYILLYYN